MRSALFDHTRPQRITGCLIMEIHCSACWNPVFLTSFLKKTFSLHKKMKACSPLRNWPLIICNFCLFVSLFTTHCSGQICAQMLQECIYQWKRVYWSNIGGPPVLTLFTKVTINTIERIIICSSTVIHTYTVCTIRGTASKTTPECAQHFYCVLSPRTCS